MLDTALLNEEVFFPKDTASSTPFSPKPVAKWLQNQSDLKASSVEVVVSLFRKQT